MAQGKCEGSLAVCERSLATREKLHGPEDLGVAESLHVMAYILLDQVRAMTVSWASQWVGAVLFHGAQGCLSGYNTWHWRCDEVSDMACIGA